MGNTNHATHMVGVAATRGSAATLSYLVRRYVL